MNKSIFNGIAMLILAAVIIIAAFFFTVSNDALRFQVEKLLNDNRQIKDRLEQIDKKLNRRPATVTAAAEEKPQEEIANREFFVQDAPDGGILISSIMAETQNLNSIINNDNTASEFWSMCYSSLADRNYAKPEIFQPLMAESWTLSNDKLTYHIKLRKGMLWHDFTDPVSGKVWKDVEITAEDFKFYVDVIKNPDVDCAPLRTYLSDLERIEIINKYEFKVVWSKRYFLSQSLTLGLQPLPRHFYYDYAGPFDGKKFNDDHQRNRIIVGCGSYRFDRWEKGQRIVFSRWEKYFGKDYGIMPKLKEMTFDVIKHPNTRFQALLAQKLDRLSLDPEQWNTRTNIAPFLDKGYLQKIKSPGHSYAYIGYNLSHPMFKDKKVRQALTMLVDRERIIKEVIYGLGRIISGPFFIDSPYNDKSIKPYPFSIEKAKALLAEAGWTDTDGDGILDKDGKKFSFNMIQVANSPTQQKTLAIVKEDMAKAGVEMNLQTVEWSVYVQRLEKKSFEACSLAWMMSYESDPYQIWHSSQADIPGSSNHIAYKNAEVDKLIEEQRVTFDLATRIKICHEIHRILHDEQPYTFLYSPDSLLVMNKKFQNMRVFPFSSVPGDILWLQRENQKAPIQ